MNTNPAQQGSAPQRHSSSDDTEFERETQTNPALDVVPWVDLTIDLTGYDPRSLYVEKFWLPVIGPTATWVLRRFSRGLDEHSSGVRIDLEETSRSLGLGTSIGPNSSIQRTIRRLCQFGICQRVRDDRVAVRALIPPLNQRQLNRLPESLLAAHERWIAGEDHANDPHLANVVARALATDGRSHVEIERRLLSWGHSPDIARNCAHLAAAEAH